MRWARLHPLIGAAGLALAVATSGCDVLEGDLAAAIVQKTASREPNFRKSRSLSALALPADLALYERLLPDAFEMPEHPLVSVAIVDQIEVGPWPLTPYQLGTVGVRVRYRGEEGWHPLTMPENACVAIWTGRTMGFPKYMADDIALAPHGHGWRGEVRDDGALRLRLDFEPADAPPPPAWSEGGWDTGGPTFNLRTPGRGPEVKVVRNDVADAGAGDIARGIVRIEIGEGEPWAGLVAPGTEVTGTLVLWEGGRSLAPED